MISVGQYRLERPPIFQASDQGVSEVSRDPFRFVCSAATTWFLDMRYGFSMPAMCFFPLKAGCLCCFVQLPFGASPKDIQRLPKMWNKKIIEDSLLNK